MYTNDIAVLVADKTALDVTLKGSAFDANGSVPMCAKSFYVYVLSSKSRNLYIGLTSDIVLRVFQHKTKHFDGHTAKYNINRLVYYEQFPTVAQAIARERELKLWLRARKIELIESMNPGWDDLSEGWSEDTEPLNVKSRPLQGDVKNLTAGNHSDELNP